MRRQAAMAAALVLTGAANLLFFGSVWAADAPAGAPPTTSRAALIQHLDAQANASLSKRHEQVMAITSPTRMKGRQDEVRGKVSDVGVWSRLGAPLAAQVTGTVKGDSFHIENVLYDGAKDEHVTANLFIPDGPGPFPAIILSPGHGASGKLSNYDFAANFARNGIVALAYDIVGEGERVENFDPATGKSRGERPTGDHSLAAFPSILGGEHVATFFLQDAVQGVSYLQSRPEVDPKRIGAFGCSGGGTVTAYLAALDNRVQAAAVACYVNDYSHLLAAVGPQDAEQSLPNFISSGLDIPDWVELAAPKPYMVISTTEDMFPFEGARAAVDEAKHVWTVLGAPDNLVWQTGPGPHGAIAPMGDKIVGFFRKSLNVPGEAVPFVALKPAREEDLMVTPTGQLVTSIGTKTYAVLELESALEVREQHPDGVEDVETPIAAYAKVTAKPGASPKAQQVSETTADGLTVTTLSFPSPMGPLEARVLKPAATGKVVLLLDPAPLDAQTGPRGRVKAWLKAGYTVVTLQVRGADGTEEIKSSVAGDENLLSLRVMLNGRTLPGIRIDDTIRAMDWVAANFKGTPVTLVGVGIMGPVALQMAALDKRVSAVRTENAMVSWMQALYAPMARDLPANTVPKGLYFYDFPDVMAAIGPRQVDIAVPVAPNGTPMREKDFRYWVGTPSNVRYLPNLDLP